MGEGDRLCMGEFDFWDRLKYLLTNPNKFFERVKPERGIGNSLLTLAVVALFASIMKFGMNMLASSGSFGIFDNLLGYTGSTTILASNLLIPLFGSFVFAGAVHLSLMIIKVKGGFDETYKAVAYSLVPTVLLSLIPIVGGLSIIYSLFLTIIGLSQIHGISKGKAVLACLVSTIVLLLMQILITLILLSLFGFKYF
ncbi:hypothetical protein A3K63_02625 [Candidatus Micrarchaeota archaeon RBG_16_49_10]|nr:MAG: hypothetical protein A3K63_02625 [Candidatus Micrarchaeota archaeon RBG_16_49_10]